MGAGALVATVLSGGRATRWFASGSLLAVGALAALLIERQIEVGSLRAQIERQAQVLIDAQTAAAGLRGRNADLTTANLAFEHAVAEERRGRLLTEAEAAARQEAARRALLAQARATAEDRSTAEWLGDLLRRQSQAAGDCPAGEALRLVRERLR